MQNTTLIIGLTIITGLTIAYYLKVKKSANNLKEHQTERERDEAEKREAGATAAVH